MRGSAIFRRTQGPITFGACQPILGLLHADKTQGHGVARIDLGIGIVGVRHAAGDFSLADGYRHLLVSRKHHDAIFFNLVKEVLSSIRSQEVKDGGGLGRTGVTE